MTRHKHDDTGGPFTGGFLRRRLCCCSHCNERVKGKQKAVSGEKRRVNIKIKFLIGKVFLCTFPFFVPVLYPFLQYFLPSFRGRIALSSSISIEKKKHHVQIFSFLVSVPSIRPKLY